MALLKSLFWLCYQLAFFALLLCAAPYLLLRRSSHYLPTLKGRLALGLGRPSGSAPSPLWIHAVSVGEVAVAEILAKKLPERLPLLITTVTITGQAEARRRFGSKLFGHRTQVAYLPFDLGWPVKRFLERFDPAMLVLTEGDYWPLILSRLHVRQVPVAVINGRLSDRAFRRQKPLGRINQLFHARVDRLAVQTAEDQRRLQQLGVDPARMTVTGNLKYDISPIAGKPWLEKRLQALAGDRPMLIAGSTMEGEDQQILTAFSQLGNQRALLLLVPRHPERWDSVARLINQHGLHGVRRSAFDEDDSDIKGGANETAETAQADVVLLDSLGELAALYRLAAAAFIGGTLVPTGGHNPLEAACFGVPVLVGPAMFNFQEIAQHFDDAEAWLRVRDADELAATWRSLLDDPAKAHEVGRRAARLLDDNRGATAHTVAMLQPLLSELNNPDLDSTGLKSTDLKSTGTAS